ncbi:MAG: response regulator [Verrucomicrobiae bacterium]|nr:response regulator [Verrucomicrobiae bacterium]
METRSSGRVLIVDDDAVSARLVTAVLSASGFLVDAALDGRQALPKIEEFDPDVVLLDLMMPGRDGFELCRLIRVNPKMIRISVIIITGVLDLDARHRGISCGATDYVTKPWQPEDLVLRVRNAVEIKRAADEIDYAYGEIDRLRSQIQDLEAKLGADVELVTLPS